MKWYNKAVIYNKTANFIIDFYFIKPNFYDWMPPQTSVASHFQKKFPKDSYINLKKLH